MKEFLENALEFYSSAEDNLVKKRFNVSLSDFFKSIVIFCDYLIYLEIKRIPKNHNDRFNLLQRIFPEIYSNVSELFKLYTKSYNLKIKLNDVLEVKSYAEELKRICEDKK
jgi:hypothetical protein